LSAMLNRNKHSFGLFMLLVRRELSVKYRGSALGYVWSMLNPLLFMVTLWSVFRHVVKDIPNYHLYVLSGVLLWNSISAGIIQGAHGISGNAGLIRKVKVSTWIFPMVPVGSAIVNLIFALVPFLLVVFVSGASLHSKAVFVPVVLVLLFLFVYGLSLFFSSLNVYFRDVGHVLEPIMQICFYATPVVFDRKILGLPNEIVLLLQLNPFTHFLEAFRACIIGVGEFSGKSFLVLVGLSFLSLTVGLIVYKKLSSGFIFKL
jgi:ABC-type polysaccharide/polyol phosphate export permease